MTLPPILFWISVLSFHITSLIYLGLRGDYKLLSGSLCDLKEQLRDRHCRLLTSEPG